jgi:hypothetical protein
MELFPHERRLLDWLEGDLREEEPDLASKFDVFTRLARGDGNPPMERRSERGRAPVFIRLTWVGAAP